MTAGDVHNHTSPAVQPGSGHSGLSAVEGQGLLRKGRPGHFSGNPLTVVTTTQHLVVDLGSAADVADAHLIPLTRHDASDDTGVVGRRTPAPAQWRDGRLDDTVGELDEPFGARKERGPEIGEDAETVDVNPQVVDDPRELINLFGTVELSFVADEVVEG